MKKTVVILRGLPGSGKTSLSKMFRAHQYISMDLFWTRGATPYKFDYEKLPEAIRWTRTQFSNALNSAGADLIVVDNTNYAKQHFQYFLDEADRVGATVHIVHVERPLEDLSNQHGVPEDKVLQMAEKWEHVL